MKEKHLQKKYSELIKNGKKAKGRKETISYFHKAEKVRTKIYRVSRNTCPRCKGTGYKRLSLENARTCLFCFGKGFVLRDYQKVLID
tara:strand:+ start:4107 stop:4367 length:261 start_codon:yes stop_codon:yes gene_type:complete